MADNNVVIKEVPIEGDNPKNDKLFETPTGNQFRVRVAKSAASNNPATLTLRVSVLNEETGNEVTGLELSAGTGNLQEVPRQIEERIRSLIVTADRTVENEKAAVEYLKNVWAVDVEHTEDDGSLANGPKLQFIRKDEEEGE